MLDGNPHPADRIYTEKLMNAIIKFPELIVKGKAWINELRIQNDAMPNPFKAAGYKNASLLEPFKFYKTGENISKDCIKMAKEKKLGTQILELKCNNLKMIQFHINCDISFVVDLCSTSEITSGCIVLFDQRDAEKIKSNIRESILFNECLVLQSEWLDKVVKDGRLYEYLE